MNGLERRDVRTRVRGVWDGLETSSFYLFAEQAT